MWEIIFMLLILKIPMVWIGWVVWWAVKAEPEVAPGNGSSELAYRPWRPAGPRQRRGGPHGTPRAGRARRRERAGA